MLDIFGAPSWTFFGISKMAQEVPDLNPRERTGGNCAAARREAGT